MKRSRFTEDQIIGILKEHEAGVCLADARHAAPDRRQEGRADILEQVPAVGDLNCLRNGTAIAAVAVASDQLDLRMGTQPGFDRGRLAIRQQIDHAAPLQIADRRSVALSLAPGPVVDADDPRFSQCRGRRHDQRFAGTYPCSGTARGAARAPALHDRRVPAQGGGSNPACAP